LSSHFFPTAALLLYILSYDIAIGWKLLLYIVGFFVLFLFFSNPVFYEPGRGLVKLSFSLSPFLFPSSAAFASFSLPALHFSTSLALWFFIVLLCGHDFEFVFMVFKEMRYL
jgi:hypothetical protein